MLKQEVHFFKDLSLSMEVLKSVKELGYENLFPIQAQAIGPLLEGKDVIGQAQTGTGKTAAFGLPMVESLDSQARRVQGLILVPTRELAMQVSQNMIQFAKYKKLRVLPVYGGASMERQIHELQNGAQIVVGTPGRTIDLIERRVLNLAYVKFLVLDEADRMLDMGFIDDITFILSKAPSTRQTALFSATIDKTVMNVCNRYMKNPVKILVSKDEIGVTQMKQFYACVNQGGKFDKICAILRENQIKRAIVFCRTRHEASRIADRLSDKGYDTQALHGGFTQPQRERSINAFRQGRLNLLIATDVAARGLDIEGITHIINYNVPPDPLVYFHRVGRTARKGTDGTAITLVSNEEMSDFHSIKKVTKTKIEELRSAAYHDTKVSPIVGPY
jgi:ATP-dependent RNA helicase DeaD